MQALTVSELQKTFSVDMKALPEVRKASMVLPTEEKGFGASLRRLKQKAKDAANE